MKRISSLMLATLVGVLLPTSIARADGINISVTPWLAPNAYGSPSFKPAIQNAVSAQETGSSSFGASGPTQYNATTSATTAQAIVTGFNSWMGVADPSDPAYAQELGNRITFAVAITSSTGFKISDLSFEMSSVGTDDFNGVGKPAGSYTLGYDYNTGNPATGTLTSYWVGFDKNGQMIDPTTYDGQLIYSLYGSGSGASEAAYCTGCTQQQQQAALNAAASNPGGPFSVTGTYSLDGYSGQGTINLSSAATPEPSSLALLGTGILGVAGIARRRFVR